MRRTLMLKAVCGRPPSMAASRVSMSRQGGGVRHLEAVRRRDRRLLRLEELLLVCGLGCPGTQWQHDHIAQLASGLCKAMSSMTHWLG